jgi:isoaspartyl peptidase/L-asparaginase-like protein (Ntn-hydrolase superfamily)
VYVSTDGAVAATGPAELLVRQMLARRIYDRMIRVRSAKEAALWGMAQLPAGITAGAVAIDRRAHYVASRGSMAWASWSQGEQKVAEPEREAAR